MHNGGKNLKNSLIEKLTSINLLRKNILWNFLAQIIPLLIALITIPLIIKGLGVERFSLLTIIWAVIGYSNLFDFGLGRALTQLIAKKTALKDTQDITTLIWTSLFIVFALGLIASCTLWMFTPFIIEKILKVPTTFYKETIDSLYLLSLTLPMILLIVSIKGILEAYQEFVVLSLLKIPVVVFNYICPLLVLLYSKNLFHLVILLVIGRVITFFLHVIACKKVVTDLFKSIKVELNYIKPLFSFGGWITVSNTVGPMVSYLDRFVLANVLSSLVVAYYTTPFDVISRMLIVSQSVVSVMFPAFSAEYCLDKKKAKILYFRAAKYILFIITIPSIIIFIFAHDGLSIWLNDSDFATKSYLITQILIVAVFFESLNNVPIGFIQGTGHANITGLILIFELPFYLMLLYLLTKHYGIIGVPLAYLCRCLFDTAILNYFALKLLKLESKEQYCITKHKI